MRFLLQRCTSARVTVIPEDGCKEPYISGEIDGGFVVFVGFGMQDTEALSASRVWDVMIEKMLNLRVFSDEVGKMNRSLLDCGGSLLVVSQFTLYADVRHGRRPSFTDAAPPAVASALYKKLLDDLCGRLGAGRVRHGIFGAMMDVAFTNSGPVTVWLDSQELFGSDV